MFLILLLLSFQTFANQNIDFQKISKDPYWHKLMHYRVKIITGIESEVDGKDFYFSKDGKYNPLTELKSSYEQLVSPYNGQDPNRHPHCRFPARMKWIKKVTSWKGSIVKCPDFDIWLASLDPQGAALVYANNFPNNPASSFGHTFLKIISKSSAYVQKPHQGSQKLDILDYAIGYSAQVGNHFYLDYFIKGMFGGYKGYFDLAPYYMKVRDYNRSESRDLWEYHLNISSSEMRNLLSHFWELGKNSYFDYYFFDENCSYHVLGLLDIAKPQWSLSNRFNLYVSPPATVKVLFDIPNAIKKTVFRPSLYKKLTHRISLLSKEEKKRYNTLIEKPHLIKHESNTTVIETILNQYTYLKKKDPKTFDRKYSKIYQSILLQRSKLENTTKNNFDNVPLPPSPHLSHKMSYAELAVHTEGSHVFETLEFGPARHDLLSSNIGQPKLSTIRFLNTKLNYSNKRKSIQLDDITLIHILSLFPSRGLALKPSFEAKIGLHRSYFNKKLAPTLDIRVGLAESFLKEKITLYFLPGIKSELNKTLKHGHEVSTPLKVGILLDFEKIKVSSYAEHFLNWRQKNYTSLKAEASWIYNQNIELRFGHSIFSKKQIVKSIQPSITKASLLYYF